MTGIRLDHEFQAHAITDRWHDTRRTPVTDLAENGAGEDHH
jgi:hypothetical protein